MENRQYEKYLSQQLYNDVSSVASSATLNSFLLDGVITEKEINSEQLAAMKIHYRNMTESGWTIVELAESLGLIDEEEYSSSPYPMFMLVQFRDFVSSLERQMQTESLSLSDEYLERIYVMKELNQVWFMAVHDHIQGVRVPDVNQVINGGIESLENGVTTDTYKDVYWGVIINKKDWVKMVKQIQKESQPFDDEIEQFLR
jgi:hypothetical protein